MKYPTYLFTLIIALVIVQGQNTIVDVIQNDSQFSSISQFASLLGDLNSSEFLSAFIPTNTAVSEVPSSIINTISSNGLAGKVLKYHLLKGQIQFPNSTNSTTDSTSSSNSTTPTIFDIKDSLDNSSGPVYLTSRNGSYFFNNYIRFDPTQGVDAQNATVYPVNKVALADFTLEGFIRLFNDTYLLAALEATGLEDSVDRSGVTLLAPSNQAISTFLQNQNITDIVFDGSTTPDLGSLTPVITNLLRYHVLAGIRSWLEITNDLLLPTGSGGQSQLRFNIYNNDIFTVNGKVIQQGGWIKDSDDNDDNNSDDNNEGPYDDDLAVFRRRTGFFYQLDDVLVPPAYSAYQYIGLISNFSSQIPQSTQDLLTQEAITVFYVRDATELTLYVLNGTVFLPGLFSGTYNTLPINSNQTASTITVSNDGQTVTVQDQFTLISSQLVSNGVVHLLSSSSTGSSSSASPSGSEASSGSPSVTETDSLSSISSEVLPSASA